MQSLWQSILMLNFRFYWLYILHTLYCIGLEWMINMGFLCFRLNLILFWKLASYKTAQINLEDWILWIKRVWLTLDIAIFSFQRLKTLWELRTVKSVLKTNRWQWSFFLKIAQCPVTVCVGSIMLPSNNLKH